MHDRDMGGDVGEMQRLLNRSVAAADDDHRLAAEEKPVAGRAGRDAEALERILARDAEPFGFSAGRQDDRLGGERSAAVAADDERPPSELERHHMFALDARAHMLGLGQHLFHQPRPLDRIGESGIVLDVGRGHQLSARLEAREHERLQKGARGVNRRRVGGRPGADNDNPLVLNSGRRQFDPRIWALLRGPSRRACETSPLYGGESSTTTAPFAGGVC